MEASEAEGETRVATSPPAITRRRGAVTAVTPPLLQVCDLRVEFRTERTVGLIHVPLGKASFSEEQLMDNLRALVRSFASHDQLRRDVQRLLKVRGPGSCT